MEINIVNRKAFHCVGVKWSGTFEQEGQGAIKNFHQELRNKLGLIKNACNPDVIIGLSYIILIMALPII